MNIKQTKECLAGPGPSIRTPLCKDGSVDYKSLKKIIGFCLQAGSNVLVLTVGGSHYICLSDEEIAEITRITCEHARCKAKVVAADCYYSTDRAIKFAKYCNYIGADMLMLFPPD